MEQRVKPKNIRNNLILQISHHKQQSLIVNMIIVNAKTPQQKLNYLIRIF
jgi:hypothetical protein